MSLKFSEARQLPTFHTEPLQSLVFPDVGQSQRSPSNRESTPHPPHQSVQGSGHSSAHTQAGLSFLRWQQRFTVRIISKNFSSAQASRGEVTVVRGDRMSPASKLLVGLKAEIFH